MSSAERSRSMKADQAGLVGLAQRSDPNDTLRLSAKEEEILELYDRLESLEVQTAILRANLTTSKQPRRNAPAADIHEQLKTAQRELLDARALYSLRNRVVEGVLTTDPTLKAVHSGEHASPAEKLLLPHINRRDVLSMCHANLASDISKTLATLTELETEHITVQRRNIELTAILMELVGETKSHGKDDVKDARLRAQIEELEEEHKVQRSRWRIMKSVVSAVVAGSGVDWASDEQLRELVFNAEEELG